MNVAEPRARIARERPLLVAAVVTGLCQVALALRAAAGQADDYWATAAIGWAGALYLVWHAREAASKTAAPLWQAVGGLGAVGSVVALAATPQYRGFLRVLPFVAGASLALAASGARLGSRHRGPLLMLALPLVNPVPIAIRPLFEPALAAWTAYLTFIAHRALGHAITLVGSSLSTAQGTLDVLVGCSGLLGISRLWVLSALVSALFPATARRTVALFVSATAVGFVVNVARMVLLEQTVMRRDDASFDYWHQGPGGDVFSVLSVATAGVLWWLILRRWRAAPAATLRPSS
jgi:cyanoexosortase A